MRRKFLPLLLLLASAVLSANIRYAAAQHQTFFIIDPCSSCKIRVANGTGVSGTINSTFTNGTSASLENGRYNITTVLTSGYTFVNWTVTSGIIIQNATKTPTNITIAGSGPDTLTLHLKAPVTTIQPIPILFLALVTASLPILLKRAKKPIGSV